MSQSGPGYAGFGWSALAHDTLPDRGGESAADPLTCGQAATGRAAGPGHSLWQVLQSYQGARVEVLTGANGSGATAH
jgi:hypothetical protein